MSVKLLGAVLECGPKEIGEAFVMVAIADNADDFGFACPSHELIASKSRQDVRTVIRKLDELEREGWLARKKKIINGKGNAYFLNLEKLGVPPSLESRRSPLHTSLIKRNGDKLTPIFSDKNTGDRPDVPRDTAQPTQVTNPSSQVTEPPVQATAGVTLTSNRAGEPSGLEASTVLKTTPTPPSGGASSSPDDAASQDGSASVDARRRWDSFRAKLKSDLSAVLPGHVRQRFTQLDPERDDFEACFSAWWLWDIVDAGTTVEFVTTALDEELTRKGVAKYDRRLEQTIRLFFALAGSKVKFTVRVDTAVDTQHRHSAAAD